MARHDRPKRLYVDFDGVLHSYTSGWLGPTNIPDPPVVDAETGRTSIQWLTSLLQSGHFEVHVFSRRAADPEEGGIQAMKKWLLDQDLEPRYLDRLKFPPDKPDFWLLIDDRCRQFTGEFPDPFEIKRFRPWRGD